MKLKVKYKQRYSYALQAARPKANIRSLGQRIAFIFIPSSFIFLFTLLAYHWSGSTYQQYDTFTNYIIQHFDTLSGYKAPSTSLQTPQGPQALFLNKTLDKPSNPIIVETPPKTQYHAADDPPLDINDFQLKIDDYKKAAAEDTDALASEKRAKAPSFVIHHLQDNIKNPVVARSMSLIGVPYKWGGNSASEGLDCSGFVIEVYEQFGHKLPRTALNMAKSLRPVRFSEIQPGDLVFFNTRGFTYSHVGIYLGNNLFAHAPRTGKRAQIEDISELYWRKRFNGARHVPKNFVKA